MNPRLEQACAFSDRYRCLPSDATRARLVDNPYLPDIEPRPSSRRSKKQMRVITYIQHHNFFSTGSIEIVEKYTLNRITSGKIGSYSIV